MQRAYVIDVDMGYGHSRAAFALKHLSGGKVITANRYEGIGGEEFELWRHWREAYETLSRLRPFPFIGKAAFEIVEKVQEIPNFYPRRDLSKPNLALRQAYFLIEKKGLGRELTTLLNKKPKPVICTHPVPAFALEAHGYTGPIWCIPTDADVARPWVAKDPRSSSIQYCCSNGRLIERLKLYGVAPERLHLTGFPLPKELIGGPKAPLLRRNLARRLLKLDPANIFHRHYAYEFHHTLRSGKVKEKRTPGPVTLMYAVGGAGAQREIGRQLLMSLKSLRRRGEIHLILVAGTREDVAREYQRTIGSDKTGTEVLYHADRQEYFARMTEALHRTDILWTKPSELSFYTALGLPIIMAPPLGRQEEFNAMWLTQVGGGIAQGDPRYTHEWLFDWLNSGGLARAAWNGYIEAPTNGTYRIEKLVFGQTSSLETPPL